MLPGTMARNELLHWKFLEKISPTKRYNAITIIIANIFGINIFLNSLFDLFFNFFIINFLEASFGFANSISQR